MKALKGLMAVAVAMAALAVRADVVNLLQDPGFEAITGNEPDVGTAPWFTVGEAANISFRTATTQAHSGSQSVQFNYYYDSGAIVQNLDLRVKAGKDYDSSVWMLISDQSANANHTNAPTLNITLWTSDALGGTYTYRQGFVWGALNSEENVWEQFSGTLKGSALSA